MVWLAQTSSGCKDSPFFALAIWDVVLFLLAGCCCGIFNSLIVIRQYQEVHDPYAAVERDVDA
jgi:hypothetical protein